MKRKKV